MIINDPEDLDLNLLVIFYGFDPMAKSQFFTTIWENMFYFFLASSQQILDVRFFLVT